MILAICRVVNRGLTYSNFPSMTEFHNEVKDLMRFAGHGLQKCTV